MTKSLYCRDCDITIDDPNTEQSVHFLIVHEKHDAIKIGFPTPISKDKVQCKAEMHSKDGRDSLPFHSHKLICQLEEGHTAKEHLFWGGHQSVIDNRALCQCPRCQPSNNSEMGIMY